MFACASYELTEAFEENISQEITQTIRRLRHHACLALWCGNNEMESQTLDKAWEPSIKQTYDYIKLYEYIIPKLVKQEDPDTFYWPSSPSSGGNFDNPWDENRGDAHDWSVWHGNLPFSAYRTRYFRYLSEFGFQAFPCLRTVEAFTEPSERNIFSRIMEMHQRSPAANGKIMNYLSATFLYPQRFDLLLFASQLLQAEAIRYGVEHNRRHRGRCMGTIVWQLNDIWPTASWSSIDYFGRWKALHYAEKRMFAPILISCEEVGEMTERPYCIQEPAPIEKSARLAVSNETRQEVCGVARFALRTPDARVLREGACSVTVPALSSVWLEKLDCSAYDEHSVYISFSFETDEGVVSEGSALFTAPKHFLFQDPQLTVERDGAEILVKAGAYARMVEVQSEDAELLLSDNYFDMNAGEKRLQFLRGSAERLTVRSVYDIR